MSSETRASSDTSVVINTQRSIQWCEFPSQQKMKKKGRLAIETINEWECHEGEVSN